MKRARGYMRNFGTENERPVVGECVMCGKPIYGADDGHYADTYFVIDSDCVCEDCTTDYLNKYCKRGD